MYIVPGITSYLVHTGTVYGKAKLPAKNSLQVSSLGAWRFFITTASGTYHTRAAVSCEPYTRKRTVRLLLAKDAKDAAFYTRCWYLDFFFFLFFLFFPSHLLSSPFCYRYLSLLVVTQILDTIHISDMRSFT